MRSCSASGTKALIGTTLVLVTPGGHEVLTLGAQARATALERATSAGAG